MDKIRHKGVIESISGCKASIRVVRMSACSSCGAKATCRGHGVKDFVVDVTDKALVGMKTGDAVVVEMPMSVGRNAVLVGFVAPLLLVLMAMSVAVSLGGDDTWAAIVSGCVLAMYYCGLYVVRHRLDNRFRVNVGNLEMDADGHSRNN